MRCERVLDTEEESCPPSASTRQRHVTPEQYVAGLTDFGPGRSEIFSNSADDYLVVHDLRATEADVTEGSGGVWERLHYDWSNPNRVVLKTTDSNVWSNASGYTYTFTRSPDGTTDVNVVIVRKGKNAKGRFLALVLGTVGKRVLGKSFVNSVKAIEARNNRASANATRDKAAGLAASRASRGGPQWARLGPSSAGSARARSARWRWTRSSTAATTTPAAAPPSSPGSPPTGVSSWEQAPAPALVGKQVLERLTGREVPPRYARSLNNVMHWGLGLATGAGYGLVMGSRRSRVWYGLPFGAAVWAGGYIVLPRLGVYEQIWKYDLKTLEKDLSAHLVFGSCHRRGAFSFLSRHRRTTRTTKTPEGVEHDHVADRVDRAAVPDHRRTEDPVRRQRRLAASRWCC